MGDPLQLVNTITGRIQCIIRYTNRDSTILLGNRKLRGSGVGGDCEVTSATATQFSSVPPPLCWDATLWPELSPSNKPSHCGWEYTGLEPAGTQCMQPCPPHRNITMVIFLAQSVSSPNFLFSDNVMYIFTLQITVVYQSLHNCNGYYLECQKHFHNTKHLKVTMVSTSMHM